jgi:putative tryptophan/tyrosine transport system substrate-binding protein
MRLIGLAVVLALGIILAPLATDAQQATPTPKIGYLASFSSTGGGVDAFRDALREHGYIDGKNVVVEPRFAEGHYDRLPALAAELVRLKVDVIVAVTTPAAVVAQRTTATIPIVFTFSSDPVRNGLVASLARPGGNLTGLTDITAELVQRRLALLKDLAPRVTRVGVLRNPDNPGVAIASDELESAARRLGLELYGADVRNAGDVEPAFAVLMKARVGSLIVVADGILAQQNVTIARLATGRRLPLMGWNIGWTKAGALLSYGADTRDVQRQATVYVVKILKGLRPADLPVEQATKFDLVINLKTAKALGLTIPQSILVQADEIIR